MNYGMRFTTLSRRQGSRPSPWKRNAKSKMAVWETLQIAEKEEELKAKRKGKIHTSDCRVPKNSKER